MISNTKFLSKAFKKITELEKGNLASLTSELARERALFEEILNVIREGVLIIDSSKAQILFMNLNAKLMLTGSSKVEYPYGQLAKIISDESLLSVIRKTITENEELYDLPFEIFAPRYTSALISIQKLWRLEENGADFKGAYCILLNAITDKSMKAKQESELDKTASILSLAAGIAHEIGNPLNSINIHLHLLSKELDELPAAKKNRLKKSLKVVTEETNRLDKIVRSFLKSTRRPPIRFELAQVKDIIQDVLVLFKPQISAQKVSLSVKFDSKMPKFLMDPERISLVFTNVIKNALQAMPKGGKLAIESACNKNFCMVSVADTGVGISKESLPKVFDAYYTTKEEGSGLGLVISYQIIREHGGRIEIESAPGKGTRIIVLLPVRTEKLSLPAPHKKENKNEQFI